MQPRRSQFWRVRVVTPTCLASLACVQRSLDRIFLMVCGFIGGSERISCRWSIPKANYFRVPINARWVLTIERPPQNKPCSPVGEYPIRDGLRWEVAKDQFLCGDMQDARKGKTRPDFPGSRVFCFCPGITSMQRHARWMSLFGPFIPVGLAVALFRTFSATGSLAVTRGKRNPGGAHYGRSFAAVLKDT